MYKTDLYINGQKADLFDNESIEMNLNAQNIKDISKVFGDFSNSFTIPASKQTTPQMICFPLHLSAKNTDGF